ncbi:MAG: FAD-dependent oxidoreductase, partial [Acidobacteria bacterium]|nr:FAD-dependent oxidoreductase [Acidobacteriota bacterium]
MPHDLGSALYLLACPPSCPVPEVSRMRVLVIGGGVIGMAIAYEARRQGWTVTLVERNQCGQATSRTAAGMLVPVTEAQFGEEEIY